jgi:hypothetical protein
MALCSRTRKRLDAPNRRTLNLWWRFGLLLWAAVTVVAILISNLAG